MRCQRVPHNSSQAAIFCPVFVMVIGLSGVQFTVCNHTSDNKICLSQVWLQTELDDTKSYYQLIVKITISEKKKNSEVMKKGENSH